MQGKSSPKVRRAVLGFVVYEHPEALSPTTLRREFGEDVWQAVVDLQSDDLLRWEDGRISLSRAAASFHRLELP
jgi:hypothetical protein